MSKTLICTNTLTVVNQVAYSNHMHFYFRLGRNCPEDQFALFTPIRMTIDHCRNQAVKVALENDMDYLMFIDDDVLLPFDAYQRLKAADKDVVAGWTVIRGYPFPNMFFKEDGKGGLEHYNDVSIATKELIEVAAIGCSCVLIKMDLIRRIPPPYFITGTYHTEDIYFCMKARKFVPEVSIFVDPLVKTPHLLTPEAVTPENKEFLKSYFEGSFPELCQKSGSQDRGFAYLTSIGESV